MKNDFGVDRGMQQRVKNWGQGYKEPPSPHELAHQMQNFVSKGHATPQNYFIYLHI